MTNKKIVLPVVRFSTESKPFEQDLLGRKPFARKLTSYLDALKDGAVIAIDAPWGEGKTWFGHNWRSELRDANYNTIYFDAFANDYHDDPFIAVAASFSDAFKKDRMLGFKDSAYEVSKRVIPSLLSGALNVVAPGLGDAVKSINDAVDDYVKERFMAHEKHAASVGVFKQRLADLVKGEKPTVFFIDELDRCKPDFAVSLIERLKHFFDVENLVFVLLVNRAQLEAYVNGVYGERVDSALYLGKFISLIFKLPKNNPIDGMAGGDAEKYINYVMGRYKNDFFGKATRFIHSLTLLSSVAPLSLRDIEKAVSYYAAADDNRYGDLYAYLIVIKCIRPDLFYGISAKEKSSFVELLAIYERWLASVKARSGLKWNETYLKAMMTLLNVYMGNQAEPSDEVFRYFQGPEYINSSRAVATVLAGLNLDLT